MATNSPIWKDVDYRYSGDTLEYRITDERNNTVYKGYATRMPDQTGITINMNTRLEEYLKPDFDVDIHDVEDAVISNSDAYRTFIVRSDGELPVGYTFLYDWSYEDRWSGQTGLMMSQPVNGHLDPRMKMLVTMYNVDEMPIGWEITVPDEMEVSPQSLDFDYTGGTATLTITSNVGWRVTTTGGWISLSSASGTGDSSITITAAQNTAPSERFANIEIRTESGAISRTVAVTQAYDTVLGEYFTIEILSGDSITLYKRALNDNDPLFYKLNGGDWVSLLQEGDPREGATISVSPGDSIKLKGEIVYGNGLANLITSDADTRYNFKGNILSLVYGDNFVNNNSTPDYYFWQFFDGCNVVSAANLVLPSLVLSQGNYGFMFKDCTYLVDSPIICATTLASTCYASMFQGCTSLVTPPDLPLTTLAQMCYNNMFSGCTSLTESPVLPASTLVTSCYPTMFKGCTSLRKITCLATSIGAQNCTTNWVDGVSSTGTFVKAASATWPRSASGIPSGWTVVDA